MTLTAVRRNIAEIPEDVWDGLLARTPAATPFSRYCLQKEWWEAYGAEAHEETLVVVDASAPAAPDGTPARPLGIVPLMHRHELEPGDVDARTTIRHQPGRTLRPVPDSATAVFFGASYHADYATVLAAPADLAASLRGRGRRTSPKRTRSAGTWWTCAACATAIRPRTPWWPPSSGAPRARP